jgi:type VI secretion system protein ImpH
MAADGGRADRPVDERLFAEGWRFEFYQAVRLLERIAGEARSPGGPPVDPVGEGAEPEREAVRFSSRVGFDFPATEVDSVEPPAAPGEPARMRVNVLGLAGVLGPLPHPFTEQVIDRVWKQDTALRDFLDIFNHRLVSLLYRARKRHRPGLSWQPPDAEPTSRAAFAFLGLGTEGLRDRMRGADRALLPYTGLLSQRPRSAVGLEILLKDYFAVPVRADQFHGQWLELPPEEQTALGLHRGRNQVLGGLHDGAVLGTKVWDQNVRFELRLGPMGLRRFLDFLPIGRGYWALTELTRFYVGDELAFDVRLTLRHGEVPPCRLGAGPRLGWTSWLRTREPDRDDSQVTLSGDARRYGTGPETAGRGVVG